MIFPAPDAPVGSVIRLSSYDATSFSPGSAILCRNNAPLVAFAFAMIRRDVPVRILGRELGQGLAKIIKGFRLEVNYSSWPESLDNWFQRESKKLKTAPQRDALEDKRSCLLALLKSSTNEKDLLSRIDRLFVTSTDSSCVALSTGHKAKGREWDSVFILDPALIPSRWSKTQWELTQERNLLYVMVTRAKTSVTYINSDCWKDKK